MVFRAEGQLARVAPDRRAHGPPDGRTSDAALAIVETPQRLCSLIRRANRLILFPINELRRNVQVRLSLRSPRGDTHPPANMQGFENKGAARSNLEVIDSKGQNLQ